MTTPSEIKSLRKSLGETQVQFASRFGVSYRTVRRWEAGVKPLHVFEKMLIEMLKENGQ